eukprot:12085625-Alexandrium_andersonii.AAC.1
MSITSFAGGRGPGRLGLWSCAAKRCESAAAPGARGVITSTEGAIGSAGSMCAAVLAGILWRALGAASA